MIATAPARVALAGNPSDGYGGATLAVTVESYVATVAVEPADELSVDPPSELVRAAIERFTARGAAARWSTTIPREVGLGGSSALVIATLRALGRLAGTALGADRLAELALAVEVEDLGIAAGPQDRVCQSHGGLTFMDFGAGRVETLDPGLLPPLVLAHSRSGARPSGGVHADLRKRYDSGDRTVRAVMSALAEHARRARDALVAGDRRRFAGSVDASFDARRQLVPLDPRQAGLIDVARRCGASANYAGSGGAVVAVCEPERVADLIEAFERHGCQAVALDARDSSGPRRGIYAVRRFRH